jgi:hypothetical protein
MASAKKNGKFADRGADSSLIVVGEGKPAVEQNVSRRDRVQTRRDRVFDLVLVDGYEDAATIARLLLDEGVMKSKSGASATRLVQSDMTLIRDVNEQRRYVERRLFALREFRRIARDDSEIEFDMVTPKGETVTMRKPRWPAGVRERALHHFSEEAEALARIAGVDVTGKRKTSADRKAGRYVGCVQLDLSGLAPDDQKAIADATQNFPGGAKDGGRDDGAPN